MSMSDYLKAWPLYVLPHHWISRVIFRLTRIQSPLVPTVIRWFSRVFKVDLSEAEHPEPASYQTFNAFFTRALRPELRPIVTNENVLVSPVDGAMSQFGRIQQGRIFQAKGHDYSVLELLGGDEACSAAFLQGHFMTLYLSPRDYHRVHMPLTGTLYEQVYVPGRLFSVAGHTVRTIPRLFARNERVVALFDTAYGKMAVVLVGAINVAAIETVWEGLVTPPPGQTIKTSHYDGQQYEYEKGLEIGRFNMGSTVIVLLEAQNVVWDPRCDAGQAVRFGEKLLSFAEH